MGKDYVNIITRGRKKARVRKSGVIYNEVA